MRGEGSGGFQAMAHSAREKIARTGEQEPSSGPTAEKVRLVHLPGEGRRDPEGKSMQGRWRVDGRAQGFHSSPGVAELKGL